MRLVQLQGAGGRRVAAVEEPNLNLLPPHIPSVVALARLCASSEQPMRTVIKESLTGELIPYDPLYAGESSWKILPPIDHPDEPARCIVAGTGLTHMASAKNRDAMHLGQADLTDSMRMYLDGVAGGKPAPGRPGVAPEWFYKGSGTSLRGHLDPLTVPPYATDGGEEPEIAALYWIDMHGRPRRLGFALGNEFSDHEFEKRNYLYLAASKLRECAIGPELAIDLDFKSLPGEVRVERNGHTLWRQDIKSGESEMSHSLANLEHHHFKFEMHRRPDDVHVHFLGADAFSFGAGIKLEPGDRMVVSFEGLGRPLINPLARVAPHEHLITALPL